MPRPGLILLSATGLLAAGGMLALFISVLPAPVATLPKPVPIESSLAANESLVPAFEPQAPQQPAEPLPQFSRYELHAKIVLPTPEDEASIYVDARWRSVSTQPCQEYERPGQRSIAVPRSEEPVSLELHKTLCLPGPSEEGAAVLQDAVLTDFEGFEDLSYGSLKSARLVTGETGRTLAIFAAAGECEESDTCRDGPLRAASIWVGELKDGEAVPLTLFGTTRHAPQ